MTSYNAAKLLTLSDRGEIAVGKRADLVIADEHMSLVDVITL